MQPHWIGDTPLSELMGADSPDRTWKLRRRSTHDVAIAEAGVRCTWSRSAAKDERAIKVSTSSVIYGSQYSVPGAESAFVFSWKAGRGLLGRGDLGSASVGCSAEE